jgi:phage terminase large subunit
MTTARIQLPPKLVPVFAKPFGDVRYRWMYGGRGSGKSFNAAKMAAIFAYSEPKRVLCTREFQASIRESFHAELRGAIQSEPWLAQAYDVGVDYIRCRNGSEFFFRGLRNQIGSIRSLSRIDLTIVEEAEDAPEDSWLALEATVLRQPKSEIWPLWNPKERGSPVDNRFRQHPPSNGVGVELNWQDNPFFPASLNELRIRQQETLDPGTYSWIWDGAYYTRSKAHVLDGKWLVDDFTPGPDWDGPYFGADWGFSQDPTTLLKCWINGRRLYIEHEFYQVGLELDDTTAKFRTVPGAERYTIRADNARPETISKVRREGLNIIAARKGPGSVEDGVAFLRSFEKIIIHPRCKHTADEARLWSYKTDRLTGEVKPDLVDADNHCWDAVRYALEPLIKVGGKGGFIAL